MLLHQGAVDAEEGVVVVVAAVVGGAGSFELDRESRKVVEGHQARLEEEVHARREDNVREAHFGRRGREMGTARWREDNPGAVVGGPSEPCNSDRGLDVPNELPEGLWSLEDL